MGSEVWILLGLGVATLGGLFYYAYSKDKDDPFGVLTDLFNDTVVPGGKSLVPKSFYDDKGVIHPKNWDFKKPTF